jgi:hypothetical protein
METVFTVYRTTNLVNSKYYIGVHKTFVPNDSYLGSGKLLKRAIAKYGEENFRKEVLFQYDNAEEAFKKEFELVEAAKPDKFCYNLRQGGSGGFDWINRKRLNNSADNAKKGGEASKRGFLLSPKRQAQATHSAEIARMAYQQKENWKEISKTNALLGVRKWTGSKHTEQTKNLLRIKNKGAGNSNFGNRWVCSSTQEIKRIPVSELDTYLRNGWKAGKKLRPIKTPRSYTPRSYLKGEETSMAILTTEKVLEIKKRLAAGESQSKIARDYGVSRNCIWEISHKKSWGHLN